MLSNTQNHAIKSPQEAHHGHRGKIRIINRSPDDAQEDLKVGMARMIVNSTIPSQGGDSRNIQSPQMSTFPKTLEENMFGSLGYR